MNTDEQQLFDRLALQSLSVEEKMNEARKLLETTTLPQDEIAGRIGYAKGSVFRNQFKYHTGMTPDEYRNQGQPGRLDKAIELYRQGRTIPEIIKELGYNSEKDFGRKFAAAKGKTFVSYCAQHQIRPHSPIMEQAKKLLETTQKSPAEISEELKFPSYASFVRSFETYTGFGPKEYRDERRPDLIRLSKRLLERTKLLPFQIAERLGYTSETAFSKHFIQATGKTPTVYRLDYRKQNNVIPDRIITAQLLLRTTDRPVPDIAVELKYTHDSFRAIFASHVGMSPLQYRAENREQKISDKVALVQALLSTGLRPLKDIAREAGYVSPITMGKDFTAQVGMPPEEYRDRQQPERLERAKNWLAYSDESVRDVAAVVGHNASSLNRSFQKIFSMTPDQFRRQVHNTSAETLSPPEA